MRWTLVGCWVTRDCDIVDSSLRNSGEDGVFFLIDERPPDGRVCANGYGCNSLFLFPFFLYSFLFTSHSFTLSVRLLARDDDSGGTETGTGNSWLVGGARVYLVLLAVPDRRLLPLFIVC